MTREQKKEGIAKKLHETLLYAAPEMALKHIQEAISDAYDMGMADIDDDFEEDEVDDDFDEDDGAFDEEEDDEDDE